MSNFGIVLSPEELADPLRAEITAIFTKWGLPIKQSAISELVALIKKGQV